jgi:5,5'-dehydrodivanillate O-demethylase
MKEGPKAKGNDLDIVYVTYKNEDAEFHMENFPSQDAMAWETQGALTDRTKELLGESDRGITVFRRMLREQIDLVMRGGEPMALVREEKTNGVINFLTSEWKGSED